MRETVSSIRAWQDATFPNATAEGNRRHLLEEFDEFANAVHLSDMLREGADIIILLMAWAGKHGHDIFAHVDAKMEINRRRQWNIQPDGTGRHK
jgi:hypothetical protein